MSSPYSCPTIKIVAAKTKGNELGFAEINESDFDEAKHVRFEGEAVEADPADPIAETAVKLIEALTPGTPLNQEVRTGTGWGVAPPPPA